MMKSVLALCGRQQLNLRLGRWLYRHPRGGFLLLLVGMPLALLAALFALCAAIAFPFAWLGGWI